MGTANQKKTRRWSVPVVYEMYGRVEVEAESAEEAYRTVRDRPDGFGLPADAYYVDDSFRVADDDEEEALESVEEIVPKAPPAPSRHTGLTVKATVTYLEGEGDSARFVSEEEFDACDALDDMDDDMVRRVAGGEPFALDTVFSVAVELGQILDHIGPFKVDLDQDHLSDYLKARGIE